MGEQDVRTPTVPYRRHFDASTWTTLDSSQGDYMSTPTRAECAIDRQFEYVSKGIGGRAWRDSGNRGKGGYKVSIDEQGDLKFSNICNEDIHMGNQRQAPSRATISTEGDFIQVTIKKDEDGVTIRRIHNQDASTEGDGYDLAEALESVAADIRSFLSHR
jgi:hypothetical protein